MAEDEGSRDGARGREEGGGIDLRAWSDLDRLDGDMEVLAAQLRAIASHGRRWVCQTAGFEPSRLCLLRPLATLMEHLSGGFDELERLGAADWAQLRAGVSRSAADLRAVDLRTADLLSVARVGGAPR